MTVTTARPAARHRTWANAIISEEARQGSSSCPRSQAGTGPFGRTLAGRRDAIVLASKSPSGLGRGLVCDLWKPRAP